VRVSVIGSSGSGKTTLARELASRYGVPFVELDALHHLADWEPNPRFEAEAEAALAAPGWVIDGNYMGRLGTRVVAAAQLVVWLDFPLWLCLARLARRTARRLRRREELWNGNRETFRNAVLGRDGLFLFTIRNHSRRRREWPARLAGLEVVRLHSPREVARWLSELSAAPTPR
jgi:adenylate kinase family enzyme